MALAYGKHPKSYEDLDTLAVNRRLTRLGNTSLGSGKCIYIFLTVSTYLSFIIVGIVASHYLTDTFQVISKNYRMVMQRNWLYSNYNCMMLD